MTAQNGQTDRLAEEMARFEHEVLLSGTVAPSRPAPTPLFPNTRISVPPKPTPLFTPHSVVKFSPVVAAPPFNPPRKASISAPPLPPPAPPQHSIHPSLPVMLPAGGGPSTTVSSSKSNSVSSLASKSTHDMAAEAKAISESQGKVRKPKGKRDVKKLRVCGSQVWEDPTLDEWDPNDYRIFCGDLGNDVSDDTLAKAFSKYPSFIKSKVIRDKWSKKTKGYGFVSFKNSNDFMLAMTEMNGKYVGSRPIRLRKSVWKERSFVEAKKKLKEKKKLGIR